MVFAPKLTVEGRGLVTIAAAASVVVKIIQVVERRCCIRDKNWIDGRYRDSRCKTTECIDRGMITFPLRWESSKCAGNR